MKSLILPVLLSFGPATEAQTIVDGVSIDSLKIERNGAYMVVDMTMDLSKLDVDGNRAVLLTPRIASGPNSMKLRSVGVYGRRRYYFYVRNGASMLTGADELSFRSSNAPDTVVYHYVTPYREWMNGAVLSLNRRDWGCCNTLLAEQEGILGVHTAALAFFPELVFVRPEADTVKVRSLEGSARIDFVVDKTDIRPDYHDNRRELDSIVNTIRPVREDPDVTITQVWLKGFASPESPYAHNRDLAEGRTVALKEYLENIYKFGEGTIVTDYEPEDWAGLRRYVDASNLAHRTEILALIDSDMDPDAKEAKIKRLYPSEYRFLLLNCYPVLRHTEYRIAYTVRSYIDIEEIRKVMASRPQNLNLNEFYLLAQEYEPGTDEFTEVFETAVRMYPQDTLANLNAANAAMRRDDLDGAERYLKKAGNSPETVYAKGALAIRREDYETAKKYLEQARDMGLPQAARTLEQLERGQRREQKMGTK